MLARIRDGRTDLVFDLFARGTAATASDERGTPLITWCAHHGDVSAVRFLLDRGASLQVLGSDLGLLGAAFHGHWQLCQFLIERGADPNHADPASGETPLHSALCKANRPTHDHVVSILLSHGADPNVHTRAGVPTDAFMRDCRTKGETPLHRAAAFGTERSVQALLDAGGSREAKDAADDTPLAWASWHLRPPAILRRLCYGNFSVNPANASTYDHGSGWAQTDPAAMGHPHL